MSIGGGVELQVLSHLGSIFWDRTWFKVLKKSKIVCKATGLTNGSKNNKHFDDPPYHIDPLYTAYLDANTQIREYLHLKMVFSTDGVRERLRKLRETDQYAIFEHFVRKKYYILDGHKFGGLFLLYELDYEDTHATTLVFGGTININHMTRLAALCKKQGIHVGVVRKGEKKEIEVKGLEREDGKKRERERRKLSDGVEKMEGGKRVKKVEVQQHGGHGKVQQQ